MLLYGIPRPHWVKIKDMIGHRFSGFMKIFNETDNCHDDVIKWKHFSSYWPFVQGIHWSPVNAPHNGQWCRVLMFSLICAWINGWVNNGEAGDLRCHRTHCDVIVMCHTAIIFSVINLTMLRNLFCMGSINQHTRSDSPIKQSKIEYYSDPIVLISWVSLCLLNLYVGHKGE